MMASEKHEYAPVNAASGARPDGVNRTESQPPSYGTQQQGAPETSLKPIAYGPQTPAGSRLLHVYRDGLFSKSSSIMDADKTTELYRVEIQLWSSPDVSVRRQPDGSEVGSVRLRWFTRNIQVRVHDRDIQLNAMGWLKRGYTYQSPAFGESTMTWKWSGGCGAYQLDCLDAQGMPVARFLPTRWSGKKTGKFELNEPMAAEVGPAVDELVTIGCAIVEEQRRRRARNSSAGGGC